MNNQIIEQNILDLLSYKLNISIKFVANPLKKKISNHQMINICWKEKSIKQTFHILLKTFRFYNEEF